MPPREVFLTGATGFLGGHMAEACVRRGLTVCTIARPSSDTTLLDKLGVTVHSGDLADVTVTQRALGIRVCHGNEPSAGAQGVVEALQFLSRKLCGGS